MQFVFGILYLTLKPFSELASIAENPTSIITILAVSLPSQVSSYHLIPKLPAENMQG
jgi:hypothetical protein